MYVNICNELTKLSTTKYFRYTLLIVMLIQNIRKPISMIKQKNMQPAKIKRAIKFFLDT